jgi:hypothetical protein
MKSTRSDHFFGIIVVDETTGRGIPLVEISLINGLRDYTDSNGVLAFFEADLMNREVFFQIRSPGYRYPTLLHGRPGIVLKPVSGDRVTVTLTRINVAERLYRITGEGIYRHSLMLDRPVPPGHIPLNAGVMGQDTVQAVPYRGKIFWVWGDTWGPDTFNFAVSGATSPTMEQGGTDPDVGVRLSYFVDDNGFSKPMCPDFGPGRVWIDWILPCRDDQGQEHLIARYTRVKSLNEILECGFAILDDDRKIFRSVRVLPPEYHEPHRSQHPFVACVNGLDYIYFTAGYRFHRVRARLMDIIDPLKYEYFGRTGKRFRKTGSNPPADHPPNPGRSMYGWKKHIPRIDLRRRPGRILPSWIHLKNIETGFPVNARPGSIFWNPFRNRWIMIAQEDIGQIWFAEADTPVGPWVYARKVVSHSNTSFYNPAQHPFFDRENGRIIHFEGTYSHLFSGNADQTPRYDYNQLMYRLDLANPLLFLPQPVYRVHDTAGYTRYTLREGLRKPIRQDTIHSIAFFAMQPDRAPVGLIPFFAHADRGAYRLSSMSGSDPHRSGQALFCALPAGWISPEQQLTGRWQCQSIDPQGLTRPFVLDIERSEHALTAHVAPDILTVTASHSSGSAIDLILRYDHMDYHLHGEFGQGHLTGYWQRLDREESGFWEGTRADFAWKQRNASAVVPLYEYWNPAASCYGYSTRPDPENRNWIRSESPVCRVWENPMTDLVLDFETEPVT